MSQVGDVVIGPREQLFHLLAEASEIEHTLMCSYLFLAFSLKAPETPGLSAAESAAVARWSRTIKGVAIEEMSHLLIVANLSIALGGRPHFGRPNFPVSEGYFPSGVVVRLTAFSMETLDHVIFLERPRGVQHEDGDGFEPKTRYMRGEAYHGLMPSVQDYETVGDLYDALAANLRASAARLGEDRLFIGAVDAQVAGKLVGTPSIGHIAGLDDALQAVATIVEQGEGSPQDREDSHYSRFALIRKEYRELLDANPSFEPAWPVADDPVMRRPPDPEGKTFIDGQLAARVLDYANAAYSLLLRLLVQTFGRQGTGVAATQQRLIEAAIELMHVVGLTGRALATLPASPSLPGNTAGMTFTMLRSVEPFLVGAAERTLVDERFAELCAGARDIEKITPELQGLQKKMDAAFAAFRG